MDSSARRSGSTRRRPGSRRRDERQRTPHPAVSLAIAAAIPTIVIGTTFLLANPLVLAIVLPVVIIGISLRTTTPDATK